MPNTDESVELLQASLSRITPVPAGRVSLLRQDEINDENPVGTQVHEEASNPDDEDEDEDADASPLHEGEDNQGRDTIMSKITEGNQMEISEQNWMLLELQFKQQAK